MWLDFFRPFRSRAVEPAATTSTWRIGPSTDEIVDMAAENEKLKAALALSESCVRRLQNENATLKAKLRSRASKKGWDTRRARG